MNSLRSQLRNFLNRHRRSWKRAEAVFNKAYYKNAWGSKESASGTGSEQSQTRILVEQLPGIFKKLGITSLLDLPCGDLNWMRHVDLGDIRYTGADIVTPIIEKNVKEFAGTGREFFKLNLITDDLPVADLIFCRDCLVHLSNDDITSALANIGRTGARFLATTTFTNRTENPDIPTGCWRPINLERPPFSLPPPLLLFNEHCTEVDGLYSDKCLGIWEVDTLQKK
jgi:hypothetical protein